MIMGKRAITSAAGTELSSPDSHVASVGVGVGVETKTHQAAI
jgi:hypothetical protein